MEAQRETQPRPKPRDAEDDAWTPADPDPRDAFDETLPADRSGWQMRPNATDRSNHPPARDGERQMGAILVGTSSWNDHEPFYPPGTEPSERLGIYARHFPVVEVNTTYYRIPRRSMVERWVERTPPGFIFDVKPPRALTSTPEEPRGEAPEPDAAEADAFAEAIAPLAEAGKLGAITFQFPPSYRNTEEHRDYLRLLPELFPDSAVAVEFRRRDWLDEEHAAGTLDLLREAGLIYTMADEPQFGSGSVPPVYGVTNPHLSIVRFHGRNAEAWYRFTGSSRDRFDWDYTQQELAEWTPKIERAAQQADRVHVFFNTNRDDQGPRNAVRLMDMLDLPHPPLAETAATGEA